MDRVLSGNEGTGPGPESREPGMKERMAQHDWRATPLGPVEEWPAALRIAYQIMMSSRFPMFIWWGPQLINLYNDAYVPMLGKKHPAALARPAAEVWYDIWDIVGKQADVVLKQQQATWNEEVLLVMERYGYTEETYFTWSYSPIGAGEESAAGLFCAVTEDTLKVIGRRRLRTLRELATETANLRSPRAAFAAAVEVINRNPHDIPFALVYEADADGECAVLAGAAGVGDRNNGARGRVPLDAAANGWGVDLRSDETLVIRDLGRCFEEIPNGPWPVKPTEALVIPFAKGAEGQATGFMLAGISSFRRLDDDYRGYLALVAGQISTAVFNSRAHQRERRRADSLAEIDRAKTAFFSNVSHEFRTPLTLLLAPLEDALANRHGILPMGAAASLTISHRNAMRLLKLVNTMLDFSRIEAGRATATYQPVDLPALTADLASNFRSLCEKAGLRLIVSCPPFPPGAAACVDRDMWERIVLNLVSNAFKFTLHGEIEVRLDAVDGQAVLTVRDTGVGIPPEELPHTFERFHRIEQSRGRTHEGTGIGLALVQELTRLHGGRVEAESVAGTGSTFRVTIPLGTAHLDGNRVSNAPQETVSARSAVFVEEALRWLPDAQDAEIPQAYSRTQYDLSPQRRAEYLKDKPRILWADDNADMRIYVSRLLASRFDVQSVRDGASALETARERKPDMILADVMMPGLDGFGLLREIRADLELCETPVILLSARAGEDSRIEGLQAGADDYLTKPFSSRELLALVESHLKLARMRRETNEALRQADRNARLLAAIVESSEDAIISKDLDGVITSWNHSAERLFGYTAAEAVGQSITMLIPPERMDEEPRILAALRRGEQVENFETVRVRKDGTRVNTSLTISPVRDAQGRIVGASKTARDISARVRQETALQQANSRLRHLADSASHDLRDLAGEVTAQGRALEQEFGGMLGERGEDMLRHVTDAATRMGNLLSELAVHTEEFADPSAGVAAGETVKDGA